MIFRPINACTAYRLQVKGFSQLFHAEEASKFGDSFSRLFSSWAWITLQHYYHITSTSNDEIELSQLRIF